MSDITIEISGCKLSGKSSVAYLIAKALNEAGITALLIDDNGIGIQDEFAGVVENTIAQRVEVLNERDIEVSIRTILNGGRNG